ncbi:MAG: GNAT family N-acetyltransferase [Ardenticatenaceae bacterium]|nr:GNAT family N-acetyltransferase [Ardenticatenaceae bacterium]
MAVRLEQIVTLRDGRRVQLRLARGADAESMAAFRAEVAGEGRFFGGADDLKRLATRIRATIPSADSLDALELLALHDDVLVGDLWFGRREEALARHCAEVYMALATTARGVGLGSAMMRAALRWGRIQHIEKVEGAVRAGNDGVRALLRKFGFREEGRRRDHYKTQTGEYEDEILYALWLIRH